MENCQEINPVVKVMMDAYRPNSKCIKVISMFYESIMECKGNSTLYLKSKWENKLNVEISSEVWYDMCETQHTSTSSHQWRVFHWKNLVRFFFLLHIKSVVKHLQHTSPVGDNVFA